MAKLLYVILVVSTRSRPKAADQNYHQHEYQYQSFNTQPPEGG